MHVHTWSSSTTPSRSQTTRTGPDDFSGYVLAITNLDGRLLKKPMSIIVEVLAENEYLAKFPESGIGIAGDSFRDAIFALKAEIVATLELYRREPRLSVELRRRLKVLEKYVGEEGRKQATPQRR